MLLFFSRFDSFLFFIPKIMKRHATDISPGTRVNRTKKIKLKQTVLISPSPLPPTVNSKSKSSKSSKSSESSESKSSESNENKSKSTSEGKNGKYATYLQQLESDGYCVIPDIVGPTAVKDMLDGMWEWVSLWGIDKEDSNTWVPKKATEWIPGHKNGIIQQHSASHTRPAWQARSEPGVLDVFANIWDCKISDLEPSYDAINFGYVASSSKPKPNYHTDQGSHRVGLWQVQGFVALTPQGSDTKNGALMVRHGSHKNHSNFFINSGKSTKGKDWYKYTPEELEEYFPLHTFPEVHVDAAPGSLVLWDSRTIHYGRQPYLPKMKSSKASKSKSTSDLKKVVERAKEVKENKENNKQNDSNPDQDRDQYTVPHPRAVIYVCMKHRKNMTLKSRKKKCEWLNKLRTTSHSPDEGHMFSDSVRTWSAEEKIEVDRRVAAFKVAAALKPTLVYQNVAAIRKYLQTRGVETLLCSY